MAIAAMKPCIPDDGTDNYAARMEPRIVFGVIRGQFRSGLVAGDRLMFRAVVLEYPVRPAIAA